MDSIEKAIETNPFDHILYEFSMYLQASILISSEQFINNLLVDSRMVHFRNLAYFFSSEKDKGKGYLHYTTYMTEDFPETITHELFTEIQRITSNSTCHLLKGRFSETFKEETTRFEQSVFPRMLLLIKKFLSSASDNHIRDEYKDYWENGQIQENAKYIEEFIAHIERSIIQQSTLITTE